MPFNTFQFDNLLDYHTSATLQRLNNYMLITFGYIGQAYNNFKSQLKYFKNFKVFY